MTSQLQAVAPAFGVHVKVEAGNVLVQISDSGGRGTPHFAAFVSVEQAGARLRMAGKFEPRYDAEPGHDEQPRYDEEILKRAGIVLSDPPTQTVSPYQFKVPLGDWPARAPEFLVLVLLLYIQAEGIGGNPRSPRTARVRAVQPNPTEDNAERLARQLHETADAITEALAYDTLDDLRGGLVKGTLEDRDKTSRSPGSALSNVTFAVASCHYPCDILDHMPDGAHATRGPADASLLALGKLLGKPNAPTLLLLAGDQVYADATAGLFDPKVLDDNFRIPYERRGQTRGAKAVMQDLNLPVEMMMDDHEVHDNWAPNDPEPEKPGSGKTAMERGRNAYFKYERALPETSFPAHVWHSVEHHRLPFFLGDTRTEREGRTALNWPKARIMSDEQFRRLCDWLVAPQHSAVPKFVLTPSALLPRHLAVTQDPACALHSDAWDGHPRSLHALLKFACDNQLKGLVFLSGDEHIPNLVTAHVTHIETNNTCTLHSIHSSALYAPYPFANAVRDDFKANDTFRFPDPEDGPYRCVVETRFPEEGDGFALITARCDPSNWRLDVEFHSARGLKPKGSFTLELGCRPSVT